MNENMIPGRKQVSCLKAEPNDAVLGSPDWCESPYPLVLRYERRDGTESLRNPIHPSIPEVEAIADSTR